MSSKTEIEIVCDDLSGAATCDLLRSHLARMREVSPPGTSFALDIADLRSPDVTVWSGWIGPRIAKPGDEQAQPRDRYRSVLRTRVGAVSTTGFRQWSAFCGLSEQLVLQPVPAPGSGVRLSSDSS